MSSSFYIFISLLNNASMEDLNRTYYHLADLSDLGAEGEGHLSTISMDRLGDFGDISGISAYSVDNTVTFGGIVTGTFVYYFLVLFSTCLNILYSI